jgi:opacity protein-like surface antigen
MIRIFVLSAALIAGSAMAEEADRVSVFVGVGKAQHNVDSKDLYVSNPSYSSGGTAASLGLTYRWNRNLSAELMHSDFGKVSYREQLGPHASLGCSITQTCGSRVGDLRIRSTSVSALLSIDDSGPFTPFARVGFASVARSGAPAGAPFNDSSSELILGVGFDYRINRNIKGVIDWQYLGTTKSNALLLGVRFGG